MEQTPRAQPFLKYSRVALISAAVTGDIRLSELLLVSTQASLHQLGVVVSSAAARHV